MPNVPRLLEGLGCSFSTGTVQSAFHALPQLILTATVQGRSCYYPHLFLFLKSSYEDIFIDFRERGTERERNKERERGEREVRNIWIGCLLYMLQPVIEPPA